MTSTYIDKDTYKLQLNGILSRNMIDNIAVTVYDDVSNFERIFDLIFDTNEKVAWRAAWACEKIVQKFPEFIDKNKYHQIEKIALTTKHNGLHRLSLSILNSIPILDFINVELINCCFEWMISSKQPIANQALSLKLLVRFCRLEPELIPELIAYLNNYDTDQLSPGMSSCRKNALKVLKKS